MNYLIPIALSHDEVLPLLCFRKGGGLKTISATDLRRMFLFGGDLVVDADVVFLSGSVWTIGGVSVGSLRMSNSGIGNRSRVGVLVHVGRASDAALK